MIVFIAMALGAGVHIYYLLALAQVYIAIVFTSLFFTMSTGGLEHFIPGCSTEYWDGREIMRY